VANEAAVEKLKAVYARWHETKGGCVDEWLALLDDNVKFGSVAAGTVHLAFATTYSNKQALGAYFDGLLESWDMLHFTPHEFIVQGDAVAMRGVMSWRNKRTGKVFTSPKADFWRFRDGKAVEFFDFFDTAGAQAAAIP
jgi:ketosteroid isomerase-like protein